MASVAFDGFMVIGLSGGGVLRGETTDQVYAKLGASEILSFSFTSNEGGSRLLSAADNASSKNPGSFKLPPLSIQIKDPELNRQLQLRDKMISDQFAQQMQALQAQMGQQSNALKAVVNAQLADAERQGKSDQKSDSTEKGERGRGSGSRLKVTLSKNLDSASPGLLQAYCGNAGGNINKAYKPFESVTLSFRKAGGTNPVTYLKIYLYGVDVTSYKIDSGSGDDLPKEDFTLGCESFKVDYTGQSATGGFGGKSKSSIIGWDFEKNKPPER